MDLNHVSVSDNGYFFPIHTCASALWSCVFGCRKARPRCEVLRCQVGNANPWRLYWEIVSPFLVVQILGKLTVKWYSGHVLRSAHCICMPILGVYIGKPFRRFWLSKFSANLAMIVMYYGSLQYWWQIPDPSCHADLETMPSQNSGSRQRE